MISAIQFVGERSAGTDGPQDSRVPREVKRCRAEVEEYRDERDVGMPIVGDVAPKQRLVHRVRASDAEDGNVGRLVGAGDHDAGVAFHIADG